MTTTLAAVSFVANGQPFCFQLDSTDGGSGSTQMLSVVSSKSLGDTFPNGAKITALGPVTLNSSDGAGASKSVLGAVITDPQNNVVAQIDWVDPETAPVRMFEACNIPVGLNWDMNIITTNT